MINSKKTYAVIRAIYDNSHSPEDFERELDFVLTRKVCMVIIEPESLGEVTWRWIRTGNWLHKTAVISGLAALATAGIGLMWNSTFSINCLPVDMKLRWLAGIQTDTILVEITPRIIRFTTALLSGISASAAGLYALFWQWDPCCKYQVAPSLSALPRGVTSLVTSNINTSASHQQHDSSPTLGSSDISPSGSSGTNHCTIFNGQRTRTVIAENRADSNNPPLRPVVLVHRDDNRRKVLHNTIAFSSALVAVFLLFRWSHTPFNSTVS